MYNKQYPDTASGAKAFLAEEAEPHTVLSTKADPQCLGVWLVKTPEWDAIVYLAGHGNNTHNDFEQGVAL